MKLDEIYKLDDLEQYIREGNTPEYHLFWKSVLGQWTRSPFVVDGLKYPTAEHWMMAEKARLFGDDESRKEILETTNPKEAKNIGRKVKNFDIKAWNANCSTIVTVGNIHKFKQNPDMLEALMATGDKILVEASPYDKIWGIGLSETDTNATDPFEWKGENKLGFALMQTRKYFKIKGEEQ